MEIDQLIVTSISLTFRTKAFLHESDDLVALDTPHNSFPLQRHRDGDTLSRTISSTIEVSFLHAVIIPRFNIEYKTLVKVKLKKSKVHYPVVRGFVIEPRIIVISFSST